MYLTGIVHPLGGRSYPSYVPTSRIAPAKPPLEGSEGAQLRAAAFLERAEVRDVLAWMRLLVDPHDAAAVVRALARPPIELRQVDLARVIQLARRRKLDLVSALAAATESPQVPPEARERIQRFVELHRNVATGLDTVRPDLFMARLIERLGMRRRRLLAPEDAAEQRASLDAAARAGRRFRTAQAALEPARSGCVISPRWRCGPKRRIARRAGSRSAARSCPMGPPVARYWEDAEPALGELEATLQLMREEVLGSVARIGGRLGELRLDTDLDISHGVVRYLELLKLSALLQRPAGQSMAEALADINARLLAATTPLQREIFQTSSLDETLLADRPEIGPPASRALARRRSPRARSPRSGRSCRARGSVWRCRLPTSRPTAAARCGTSSRASCASPPSRRCTSASGSSSTRCSSAITPTAGETLAQLLELLEAGWRRSGFGASEQERRLRAKARDALTRYHARLHGQDSEPVWFERPFAFRLGPHHLRGRVDRVDRLTEGTGEEYELIDYKTSRPKSAAAAERRHPAVAVRARRARGLAAGGLAAGLLLRARRPQGPRSAGRAGAESVKDTVLAVGEGILGQQFEPTPSRAACSICDYRIVCPAAEK